MASCLRSWPKLRRDSRNGSRSDVRPHLHRLRHPIPIRSRTRTLRLRTRRQVLLTFTRTSQLHTRRRLNRGARWHGQRRTANSDYPMTGPRSEPQSKPEPKANAKPPPTHPSAEDGAATPTTSRPATTTTWTTCNGYPVHVTGPRPTVRPQPATANARQRASDQTNNTQGD